MMRFDLHIKETLKKVLSDRRESILPSQSATNGQKSH